MFDLDSLAVAFFASGLRNVGRRFFAATRANRACLRSSLDDMATTAASTPLVRGALYTKQSQGTIQVAWRARGRGTHERIHGILRHTRNVLLDERCDDAMSIQLFCKIPQRFG